MSPNVDTLAEQHPDVYEGQVLLNAIVSVDFYNKYRNVLCLDPLTNSFSNDFSNPADNTIYRALQQFREITAQSPTIPSGQDLYAILQMQVGNGTIIESDRDIAVPRLQELYAAQPMSSEMIGASLSYWLTVSRQNKTIARATSGILRPEELLQELQSNRDAVQQNTVEKTSFLFSEAAKQSEEEDRPRFSTGIKGLDKAIGGGLAKQEFTLIVCPSGGGKTVQACNMSYHFTTSNLKGLLITTEQPPKELVPRFVAAICDIPFDLIKDGVKIDRLNQAQQNKVMALYEHLDKNLIMVDWGQSDHSVEVELEGEIEKARKILGQVDFVILDWIGGSLGQKARDKPENFRRIMKDAADSLDRYAKREDVIAVGFAQATTMLAKNKKKVDRTMVGECKTMHEKATNLFGISALTAESEDDSDAPTYQDRQYFFIDKARKGRGGCITVRRDFAYQRFKNWGE